ncbi:hypothetical protein [Sphingomonas solaris]|uniref:Uncharacterized protein n=1 Tax=Alterirhizorhabdus solaris TaxID=2529389 RepID=A0A558RBK1_9SPHN|nr:hypothetical protein [Sphingomonas solaris]TVV76642.1 hypothetical protein FOY91_03690 [Sphingomonas solaris]
MSNALQLVLSQPTAGMDAEFNEWYGGSHMLHRVEAPGVLAGQRFRRADGPWPSGKHDYLMIWELDDPAFTLAALAKVKGTADMPISPAINMDTVQPPTMWRRAEVRNAARVPVDTEARRPVVFALYSAATGEDAALADSLLDGGLRALADRSGVLSAQYLTLADEQIRGNCRKYPHGLLIELHDEAAGVAALTGVLAALPHTDPDRWMPILFRPVGERVTRHDAKRMAHA